MFNKNFYPTPQHLIEIMTAGINFHGKYICDPEAGKGDIANYVLNLGAENVCVYEIEEELSKFLTQSCTVLGKDWFTASSVDISHVDYIIMNPPFDNADKHILHAWDIAPEGCEIIAICNAETIKEDYTATRKKLKRIISQHGTEVEYIQDAFTSAAGAERTTGVEIAFFKLFKPGTSESFDYEGFYMDEEPEQLEEGLLAYSEVKDIVGRYVASLRAFNAMNTEMEVLRRHATSVGLSGSYSLQLQSNTAGITTREEFLKELQKSAWEWIFGKLNIDRMVTTEVKEKLNKFVTTQHKIPFTEKNIYQMLNMIVGTFKENMDKAMVTVFDALTERYHENRYHVEGWKTNKAHCMGKKFILPNSVKVSYSGQIESRSYEEKYDRLTDLQKAMAYLVGERYNFKSLHSFFQAETVMLPFKATQEDFDKTKRNLRQNGAFSRSDLTEEEVDKRIWDSLKRKETEGVEGKEFKEFGKWYDFGFFMVKGFKKGTLHCTFKDNKHWEMLNRRVNEIKGYPLPEKI